jgi:glycosyltransferase involved in cell wall biosynthesis
LSVVVVQTTVPSYRVPVVEALAARLDGRLLVLAGRDDFATGVRLAGPHPNLVVVPNVYLAGRRLLWQRRCVWRALRAPVVVLDLNPRILSSWPILVLRKLAGRRTVLWGHAWPRRGPDARSDAVRGAMRRLASGIAVYTETEARALQRRHPRVPVVAAPNGLYRGEAAGAARDDVPPTDIVFVGRLTPAKKPELFLRSFAAALPALPPDVRCVFVGEGTLRSPLEDEARRLPSERVAFLGEITDFERLKAIYATAIASVSPGYVGLSLIQSLWFGVPAVIARDEPHSPEIEAAVENETCVLFDSDSVEAMRDALVSVVTQRAAWLERRDALAEATARRYSVDALVDGLLSAVAGRPTPPSGSAG